MNGYDVRESGGAEEAARAFQSSTEPLVIEVLRHTSRSQLASNMASTISVVLAEDKFDASPVTEDIATDDVIVKDGVELFQAFAQSSSAISGCYDDQ